MKTRKWDKWKRKGTWRSVKELSPFKEKPDTKWNKRSEGLRERLQQTKLQSCEKESREKLSSEGKYEKRKQNTKQQQHQT